MNDMNPKSRAKTDQKLQKLLSKSKESDNPIKQYQAVIKYICSKHKKKPENIIPTTLPEEDQYYYFYSTLQLARILVNINKGRAVDLLEICSKSTYPDINYELAKLYLTLEPRLEYIKNAKSCLSHAAGSGHENAKILLIKIKKGETRPIQQTEIARSQAQIKGAHIDPPKNQQKQLQNLANTTQMVEEINSDEDTWMIEYHDDIQMAAKDGDADAQFTLGYMYENGISVEKNLNTAIIWYEQAKKNNHLDAYCNLGYIYESHKGFKKSKATSLYTFAAQRNCLQAQYNLASCYARGVGVSQSNERALDWFKRAADEGHHEAEANLGYIYWKEKKYRDAVAYYTKAAKSGILRAHFALGYIYQTEKIDKETFDGKYIKHAEFCYTKCDKIEYLPATNNLGYLFEEKGNIEKAKEYYKKAADKKYPASQNNLGHLYIYSDNFEEHMEAEQLLSEAKANGSKHAKANLKLLQIERKKRASTNKGSSTYFIKLVLKQDFKQAYRFFEELAEDQAGFLGWYELGLLDQYVRPGRPDYEKALQHYLNAKDNPAALYQIATMYFLADGVKQDLDQAIKYLEKVKTLSSQQNTQFVCTVYDDTFHKNEKRFNFCIKTRKELLAEIYCALAYLYEHKNDHINTVKYFFLASNLGCDEAKIEVKDIIKQQNLVSINKD